METFSWSNTSRDCCSLGDYLPSCKYYCQISSVNYEYFCCWSHCSSATFRELAPSQWPLKSITVFLLTFVDFEAGGFCLAQQIILPCYSCSTSWRGWQVKKGFSVRNQILSCCAPSKHQASEGQMLCCFDCAEFCTLSTSVNVKFMGRNWTDWNWMNWAEACVCLLNVSGIKMNPGITQEESEMQWIWT